MRPVGIILVFMNLLFSVATCALIVVVYSTRANWNKEYKVMQAQAEVAAAAYKSERQAHENDLKGRDERLVSLSNQIETLKNSVTTAEAAKAQAVKTYTDYKAARDAEDTAGISLASQIKQFQKELESLQKEKSEQLAKIIELQNNVNAERKEKVDAVQKFSSLMVRNEKLMQEYSQLAQKYNQAEQLLGKLGSSGKSITDPPVTPAPKNVVGSVTEVASNGMAAVSIGSDSGVSVGNKLEVVRLDEKNPLASRYLGTITLTSVQPKQAIGTFEASRTGPVKLPSKGDEVRTSLGGK